jgi:hypothetical protein
MDDFQVPNANTISSHFMGKRFNYGVTIMEGNEGVLISIIKSVDSSICLDTPTPIHKNKKTSFG